jgi:hypothetical protein
LTTRNTLLPGLFALPHQRYWPLSLQAVHLLANDTAFRQAQDSALDSMYFDASQRAAETLGLRWVTEQPLLL